MSDRESTPLRENTLSRQAYLYTPDTLRNLEPSALPRFHAAVDLLRASIEELRDINGVETTDDNLHDHEIIYPEATPTVPMLRSWDRMITNSPERTPVLIAIEEAGEVIAVCEGRVYPFRYNRAQVEEGVEEPVEERAIFIEQTGVRPEYRGNKEDNVADRLYREVYDLAGREHVTLLIGTVNVKNERSRRVVQRQGRQHIDTPPLDAEGNQKDAKRNWPHPDGAYLPNYEWPDTDSQGKQIDVVLECFTQRLGEMPEV